MKRNQGMGISLALVAALVLGVAGVGTSSADEPRGGDRRGHHGPGGFDGMRGDPARLVEHMTRRLDLDDEQQIVINNILEAARPEFESLRDKGKANREAMWELDPADGDYAARLNSLALENGQLVTDGTNLLGRVRAEVHAVLTPEQIAEAKAAGENWRQRRARFRQ
jgi:Spy/CpxP family protein refolding chaperone